MNDGKKRRSSAELPAHKRFEKSRSRWIYPSFQNTVFVFCGDWGRASTSRNPSVPRKAERMGFVHLYYKCIACYYYTKFGITIIRLAPYSLKIGL